MTYLRFDSLLATGLLIDICERGLLYFPRISPMTSVSYICKEGNCNWPRNGIFKLL